MPLRRSSRSRASLATSGGFISAWLLRPSYFPTFARPWGGGVITLQGGARSSPRSDTVRDDRCDHEAHEGRMQTGRMAHVGSRLKPPTMLESTAWKASLSAVLGKTRRTE
jgi:hypothetical protein